MSKMNRIRLGLEIFFTVLLLVIFPFNIERKLKLLALYLFCQFIVGRFKEDTLLSYDELRLEVMGYAGFLFTAILTVAFRSSTALAEIGYIIGFTVLDFLCTLAITRYAHVLLFKKVKKNVVVVGAGKTARKLDNVTRANRFSLMDIRYFVDCNNDPFMKSCSQEIVEQRAPIVPLKDLEKVIDEVGADTVLIAIPEIDQEDLSRLSSRLNKKVDTVKYLPWSEGLVTFASTVEDFDGLLMISTSRGKMSPLDHAAKRFIDIMGGLAGCAILLPLIVYVWIKNRQSGDKDPLFFTQDRIGKNGKIFKVYKFRTMIPNAEKVLEELMAKDPAIREEYEKNKKLQHDPRITKAGKFLREKSLDEFPQFINVLKGDMSLIGPRPYLPREVRDMGDYYDAIVSSAPGITGMWQTHGRSAVSFEQRLQLDEFYFRNWSLWLDLTLLVKTIQNMFYGDNAV